MPPFVLAASAAHTMTMQSTNPAGLFARGTSCFKVTDEPADKAVANACVLCAATFRRVECQPPGICPSCLLLSDDYDPSEFTQLLHSCPSSSACSPGSAPNTSPSSPDDHDDVDDEDEDDHERVSMNCSAKCGSSPASPRHGLHSRPSAPHRRRTSALERALLEAAFLAAARPGACQLEALERQLGPHWSKGRILKWFENRKEKHSQRKLHDQQQPDQRGLRKHRHERRAERAARVVFRRRLPTGAHEREALEEVFLGQPFPEEAHLERLAVVLGPRWSRRRTVQWFSNRRKQA